jgi:hypothetical protein
MPYSNVRNVHVPFGQVFASEGTLRVDWFEARAVVGGRFRQRSCRNDRKRVKSKGYQVIEALRSGNSL